MGGVAYQLHGGHAARGYTLALMSRGRGSGRSALVDEDGLDSGVLWCSCSRP